MSHKAEPCSAISFTKSDEDFSYYLQPPCLYTSLAKKSWNVYNPENIARVRQDEAAAKAQAEKDEREQRDRTAANRLEALRSGLTSLEAQDFSAPVNHSVNSPELHAHTGQPSCKKRKLAGEDDTDRDIRLARTDAAATAASTATVAARQKDFSVIDSKGHINLIPEHRRRQSEKPQQQQQQQDGVAQEGMRLKDATGYGNTDAKPWYANRSQTGPVVPGRDVWGNEDPRRHEREQARVSASDPLLAMKRGVRQLRENEKQRKEWTEQRERDLYEVERLAREQRRKRKQNREQNRGGSDDNNDDETDSLEGFRLDRPAEEGKEDGSSRRRHRHGHSHESKHRHHQRRSRSPDSERISHRHHHRHHHRHRSRDETRS